MKWTLSIPKLTALFDYRYAALAVTCSLEHFTATLAEILLATDNGKKFLSCLSTSHRTIWIWHAIEETEHKAVAFDVYRAVGGSFIYRSFWHIITTTVFIITVANLYLWLMYDRGQLFVWKHNADLFHFLFVEPGFLSIVFPLWAHYLSPDYHPWGGGNDPANHQYKSNTLAIEAISKYTKELKLIPIHSTSSVIEPESELPIAVVSNAVSTSRPGSRNSSRNRSRANSKVKSRGNSRTATPT